MNEKIGYKKFQSTNEYVWVSCPKRIRVYFGGQVIADSRRVKLLRQIPRQYYFLLEDVSKDYLRQEEGTERGKYGEKHRWTVAVGEREEKGAAWHFTDQPKNAPDMSEYIGFDWDKMDRWFEEDEPISVEPRDPYTRLDIRQSSRKIEVVIAGETVAYSERPVMLFETGVTTRYYLFREDVRMDLLEETDKHVGCPYKGIASYFSVRVGDTLKENLVWTYPFPNPEYGRLQNLVCFYSDKIEGFFVDGEKLT